jgi:hypothetical protein
MAERFHSRGPRTGPAALVLALHVLAAALWLQLGAWRDRRPSAPTQAPLVVMLLPPFVPPAAPAPPRTRAPSPRSRPPGAPANAAAPRALLPPAARTGAVEAQPITLPSPARAAQARETGHDPTLNLALPRAASAPWRQRNPALDDARSNTAPSTLEQRVGDAMGGDGVWVEEAIDADHRRLRRGNTCVYLQRPRAAQIDPFTPGNRALPWQAGAPVACR